MSTQKALGFFDRIPTNLLRQIAIISADEMKIDLPLEYKELTDAEFRTLVKKNFKELYKSKKVENFVNNMLNEFSTEKLTPMGAEEMTFQSALKTINDYEIIEVGSSIKFCHIASGKADCYPRFGPTSEWDTAAGEAIVRSAGGHVVTSSGNSMNYNQKETYLNPNFIVSNDRITSERILSSINTHKHSSRGR